MKIAAIIPVHLASMRLHQKALMKIHGHPMVVHVYKRVLLSKNFSDVYVATGDDEIIKVLNEYNINYIKTYKNHASGTLRCAEAMNDINCEVVCVVQGDEPLLDPIELDSFCEQIRLSQTNDAWNAVCAINNYSDLTDVDIVKCIINRNKKILYMFRKYHFLEYKDDVFQYTKKIMGLFAYKKDVLYEIANNVTRQIANDQNIEQFNIIDNGFDLAAISMNIQTQSVNTKAEAKSVVEILTNNQKQNSIMLSSFGKSM